jgi:2,4-dichlorophenol 6-monooxygenase
VSTLDLTSPGRLALLVDSEHEAWRKALGTVDHPLAALVDVVAVGSGHSHRDPSGRWGALREISEKGALLVRPDSIVAWRSHELPTDPVRALAHALSVCGSSGG